MSSPSNIKTVREVDEDFYQLVKENNILLQSLKKKLDAKSQRWLSTEEAAERIGCKPEYLLRYLKNKIGYHQDIGYPKFDVRDIDRYMETNKVKGKV